MYTYYVCIRFNLPFTKIHALFFIKTINTDPRRILENTNETFPATFPREKRKRNVRPVRDRARDCTTNFVQFVTSFSGACAFPGCPAHPPTP